ncbi:hypothetical protein H6G74_27940 [Nostoc spongiaeforme FACHB-130]|uniref:Uncharacterized protein n=1 Tax=Nostoc spongiaeforme FACHB-130 TaxID=1357510 RepID=A0ABR8G4D3_9NOSO|nr:hypothetical protein [Nostoc spongiaeforme FACHB-130]
MKHIFLTTALSLEFPEILAIASHKIYLKEVMKHSAKAGEVISCLIKDLS